jgi:hypothetical protein
MAVGYTLDHGKLVEAEKIAWSNAFCAGGNLTTAHDLVTWSMAVASGKVVSPASYVRMATPTTWPDGDCSGYGFGLWIDPDSTGAGHDRTWHTGHGPGYTAAIVNYSRDELAIAVMSNSDAIESMELVDAIAVSLLGLPEPRIEDQMLPTERVREFVGTYQNARTHRSVTISEAGGHLAAKPDKLPTFTLMWQGGERFVLKEDPRTEIQFMLRGPGAAAGGQSPFRTIVRSKGGIHESAERRD